MRSRGLRLVGLADRRPGLAVSSARRLGLRHASQISGIGDIDWLDEVDALDVATAPMSHHGLIRDALLRGKHVITEKPFAMHPAQGEELVELASRQGLCLSIVHNFQFADSAQRLLGDIESGRLGALRSIIAFQWGNPARRLPAWYEELPGGLFYDESPHLLYLLRRLSPGPLRLVGVDHCPSTGGLRTPASLDASYRCATPAGELPVTLSCRFEAPLSEWHVAVLGERAAGVLDVFRDIYLRLPNDGAHGAAQVLRTSWKATSMHWLRHLVNGPLHLAGRLDYGNRRVFEGFSEAVRSGQPPPGTSARDALDVLRMQHEILERAGLRSVS